MTNAPTSRTEATADNNAATQLLQSFKLNLEDLCHYINVQHGKAEPIEAVVTKVAAAVEESQEVREFVRELMSLVEKN